MWEYSDKVKEYFFNPKNVGVIEDANGVGEVGAIACGDALKLMIQVDPDTDRITSARFQTFGCGSAIASSSALTEIIVGKTVDEALKITNQDIADFLGGLPPEKMHCSVMGYEALRAAVANYRGETWEDDHEEGALLCKCFGVDEGMLERAVRNNNLTSMEQVAQYTKATASCSTCAETVEEALERINAAMVSEGVLDARDAFVAGALPPTRRAARKTSPLVELSTPTAPAKLTTVQRIRAVEEVLTELRPVLQGDGGDCELVDVDGNKVMVRLSGACVNCQLASVTVQGIQQRLAERLGEPVRVIPVPAGH
ncbi:MULTISPECIES: Fe-S cluster assembly protein NifU [Acetobacter]|jgi:NifU-like protein|uniref:Fe-S cluster assembly protein NifU n=1 Tax=Acetobacter TaxID=434 RepID=UPI0037701134